VKLKRKISLKKNLKNINNFLFKKINKFNKKTKKKMKMKMKMNEDQN
jgi:hypothetical protein